MEQSKPIRVLQEVAGLGNGGVETFLINVYRNIDRDKVQFDFILSHDWSIHLYDGLIQELGGKIFYLPEGFSQFTSFYHFLVNHPEYRIVHSHRGAFGSFYLFISWLAGIKHRIAHSHTTGADRKVKAFFVVILRKFLTTVSTFRFSCGQKAGEWMYGNASFEVLNNAIDVESYRHFDQRDSIRHSLGIEAGDLVIGHVGRFAEVKNHSFLIDVFNEIHYIRPDSKLLLVGDGPLRGKAEEKVKDLGLSNCVIFLQNRSDVNDLLLAMDLVVFPSLYEGFSFAMLEMQASSLRILASDTISSEINIIDCVYFQSLHDSAKVWASRAMGLCQYDRQSISVEKLYARGYDIGHVSKRLESFYLSLK